MRSPAPASVMVVAAIAACVSTAGADPFEPGVALVATEIAIPDLRYEVGHRGHRPVLSWPVAIRGGSVDAGDGEVGFAHIVELQIAPTRSAVRGLLAERAQYGRRSKDPGGLVPLLEVGALLGQDGSGAMLGTGLAYGFPEISLALVVRLTATDEDARADLAFDFQVPLWW